MKLYNALYTNMYSVDQVQQRTK